MMQKPNEVHYDPLRDKYLRNFFNSQRVREHLYKTGVISRTGRILSEREQKQAEVDRRHRKKVKEILTSEVDFLNRRYNYLYQNEIQKRLDAVKKLEARIKIKGDRLDPLDDYNDELLEFNVAANSDERRSADLEPTAHGFLPGIFRQKMLQRLDKIALRSHKAYLLRQLDDVKSAQRLPRSQSVPAQVVRLPAQMYDVRDLPAQMYDELTANQQLPAQMYGAVPLPPPVTAPLSGAMPRIRSRATTGRINERQPRNRLRSRPISRPHYAIRSQSSNPYKGSFRVEAKCECFVLYLGSNTCHMRIEQQHCGGSTVVLFSGDVNPQEEVKFMSWRHVSYPFALIIRVDHVTSYRINVCCETRIAQRKAIDGARGAIVWLGVRNAVPCYKCHVRREHPTPFSNYDPERGFLQPHDPTLLAITNGEQDEPGPSDAKDTCIDPQASGPKVEKQDSEGHSSRSDSIYQSSSDTETDSEVTENEDDHENQKSPDLAQKSPKSTGRSKPSEKLTARSQKSAKTSQSSDSETSDSGSESDGSPEAKNPGNAETGKESAKKDTESEGETSSTQRSRKSDSSEDSSHASERKSGEIEKKPVLLKEILPDDVDKSGLPEEALKSTERDDENPDENVRAENVGKNEENLEGRLENAEILKTNENEPEKVEAATDAHEKHKEEKDPDSTSHSPSPTKTNEDLNSSYSRHQNSESDMDERDMIQRLRAATSQLLREEDFVIKSVKM